MNSALVEFVRRSNEIEGISGEPQEHEVRAHADFLAAGALTEGLVTDLAALLTGGYGRLRDTPGMNVRVGPHLPPPGGPMVAAELRGLLRRINEGHIDPWTAHVEYEMLHPFMDGNGRTGRAIWLWHCGGVGALDDLPPLGFLHAFYYETLRHVQAGQGDR